jgi:hypothetical protein
MRRALDVPDADAPQILDAMRALLALPQAGATGPWIALGKAELEFASGIHAHRAKSSEAKGALDRSLAALRPLPADAPAAEAVDGLHNEVLTFARARKLAVRGEYRMTDVASAPPMVQGGIPAGSRWRRAEPQEGIPLVLHCFLRTGAPRHQLFFHANEWTKNYTSPHTAGAVPGHDVKRMIEQRVQIEVASLGLRDASRKPVQQASIGRGLGKAMYAELSGTSAAGEPVTLRVWVVKGKLRELTYQIALWSHGDAEEPDPELEAVLQSFREVR